MHRICTNPAQFLHKIVQGFAQFFAQGVTQKPYWKRDSGVIKYIGIYYIVIYRIKTLHT
jgi:hypothetical protein